MLRNEQCGPQPPRHRAPPRSHGFFAVLLPLRGQPGSEARDADLRCVVHRGFAYGSGVTGAVGGVPRPSNLRGGHRLRNARCPVVHLGDLTSERARLVRFGDGGYHRPGNVAWLHDWLRFLVRRFLGLAIDAGLRHLPGRCHALRGGLRARVTEVPGTHGGQEGWRCQGWGPSGGTGVPGVLPSQCLQRG